MEFDFQRIIENKRRYREQLAARPIAEKLAMLDQLRERTLEIRASRTVVLPHSETVHDPGERYGDVAPVTAIRFHRGDATQPTSRPAVIVHVCNDVGGWGAGFVLAVSKRWPEPEGAYRTAFAAPIKPGLGDVQLIEVEPGLWVANMIAQRDIRRGPNGEPPIRYDAVRSGLRKVAVFAQEKNASVHMPRVGCGLAGGKWDDIESVIRETLVASGVDVTVYDFP